MKKVVLSVVAAVAMSGSAFAADMPVKAAKVAAAPATPAFDIAFGAWVGSDYNFRGVSQSNREASGGIYIEPQFNTPIGQFYIGTAVSRIDWPSNLGFTDPSAEVDLYGGWRNTFGALSTDLGAIYYYYPSETSNGATSASDFWEIYAKLAYAITPDLTIGANGFYTPDLLHYSTTFAALAPGNNDKADAFYGSITGKWVTPWKWGDVGTYVSGELGHWWIDGSGFVASGFGDPDYTYWNVGLAFTYKVFTLDLRYHGTDQSRTDCGNFLMTAGSPTKWCNDTFIATLKVDTTLSALMAK
ncbi:MAG TPA: TorF family putative porin [Pseudolabrys sp.]|jgi:uncharacterized protein (TIGR02001 family)|nr:TorF family putative porin [Pseudolabrys sp.]